LDEKIHNRIYLFNIIYDRNQDIMHVLCDMYTITHD
jgi:hypothetical protein